MQEMGLALHGEIKWPINNGKFANEPLKEEVCVWRKSVEDSSPNVGHCKKAVCHTGLSEREITH